MSKKKQLKELFIADLGEVTGGRNPFPDFTTLAIGEEDGSGPIGPVIPPPQTTLALGEEGGTTIWWGGEE